MINLRLLGAYKCIPKQGGAQIRQRPRQPSEVLIRLLDASMRGMRGGSGPRREGGGYESGPVGALYQSLDLIIDSTAGGVTAVGGLPHLLAHERLPALAAPGHLPQVLGHPHLRDHHLCHTRHLQGSNVQLG